MKPTVTDLYACPTCGAERGEPCEGHSATNPDDRRMCPERRRLPVPTAAQIEALRFGARYGWICLTDYAPGTQRVIVQREWFRPARPDDARPGRFADITDAGRAIIAATNGANQ